MSEKQSLKSEEMPCDKPCIGSPRKILYTFSVGWTVAAGYDIPIERKGRMERCFKFFLTLDRDEDTLQVLYQNVEWCDSLQFCHLQGLL